MLMGDDVESPSVLDVGNQIQQLSEIFSEDDDDDYRLSSDEIIDDDDADSDTFASDFYRSGTDWSGLKPQNASVLKQTSLFQCWGIQQRHSTDPIGARHLSGGKRSSRVVVSDGEKTKRRRGMGVSSVYGQGQPRRCPFYKKIHDTPFTVDAFRYGKINGCSAYFLSHFHADHYGGLSKAWSHGPIYCTALTARLVRMCLDVDPQFIHPLELDTEYVIEGIKVTMLEANHCPGAALIHFRLPDGQCHLHTGDFRASKKMETYPALTRYRVNMLYLDTTYCNSKYRFPPKEDILDFVVRKSKSYLQVCPRTLIVVGAYSIGKECVYLAISKALGFNIHANASRRRILNSYGLQEVSSNLCTNGKQTPLHVLPISSLRSEVLEKYLKTYEGQYSKVLAFRPTGWTYSEKIGSQLELIKPMSKGNVTIYGVPYSEHSSFTELREFVQFIRPEKIIPTVNNGNAARREQMQSYFRQWLKHQCNGVI